MSSDKVNYAIVPKTDKADEPLRNYQLHQAPKGFGARHVQVLILFISLTVGYTIRAQLSVSMVAMTNHDFEIHGKTNFLELNTTAHILNANTKSTNRNYSQENLSNWNVYRKYNWDEATQEMTLFSFFVGYTSMMLPMGCLAQKYGGKKPILVALAVNGLVSIVTPSLAIFGDWIAVSLCRLLQGATQAAFFPSIHTILGKWAPLSERGRLSTYIYTGSQFGTVVIFQLAGVFAGSPRLGWPATFWFCGVLSLLCFALLWWLGAASPHDHPTITEEEVNFISEGGGADLVPKKRRTPWKSILTSSAVWAVVASQVGSTSGYLLLLTQIPSYMNYILGVEIKKNGVYSSLPYVSMYITALMFGYLADYATNNKIISVVNIRRIANTIGMVVAGVFLVGFSYITSTVPAIIMLIMTMSTHSAVHVGFHATEMAAKSFIPLEYTSITWIDIAVYGFLVNHIDLSPNFAGPLMAFGNMVANLTGLLVPVIVSNVVKDDVRNQSSWQTVLLIFAGLQVLTNVIYVVFAKGTVQPWNFYGEHNDCDLQDVKTTHTLPEKNKSTKDSYSAITLKTMKT